MCPYMTPEYKPLQHHVLAAQHQLVETDGLVDLHVLGEKYLQHRHPALPEPPDCQAHVTCSH